MAESGEQGGLASPTGRLARALSSFRSVVTGVAIVWLVAMQLLLFWGAMFGLGGLYAGALVDALGTVLCYGIALLARWRRNPVVGRHSLAVGRTCIVFCGVSLLSVVAVLPDWSLVLSVAMIVVVDLTFLLWLPRIQDR